jgi:hypothetical protein
MASLVLTGDTSGQVTIAAPAVAGTTTLTLPATTGSVIGSNSSGYIQFNSGYGSVATAYGCRAWVNFNGTGTVAIRASGNVTSITDNGVGNYTINFTNAMPDNNYAFAGASGSQTNSGVDNGVNSLINRASTSSCQFSTRNVQSSGVATDYDSVNVSIFR